MGSFNDLRESGHLFNIPSERQHPTQGSVPNHCPGALGYFFKQEERVPPTGPPTPLPAAPGLPSRTNPAYLQKQASSGMQGGMLLAVNPLFPGRPSL